MSEYADVMQAAVKEAEWSLREGNSGFGAVIVRQGEIVAAAHDTEKTDRDPTAHAELTAIRRAAARFGRDLAGCQIVSTHEPCPMCATAIVWAGIDTVVYGYSIAEAIRQGRRRIDLPCREIFDRAGAAITVVEGVLHERCALLYDAQVREQIDRLRGADEAALRQMAETLAEKRLAWYRANRHLAQIEGEEPLDAAYRVFLSRLGLAAEEAPIVERERNRLVLASRNFCPTLEACRILGLDTRVVCRYLTEKPTDAQLRQIDPRLRFSRDYGSLRPFAEACREMISLEE